MKSLSCADLGASDCHFVATGATADDAVKAMAAHAMQAHPDKIAEMQKTMTQDQMMAMMASKVKDVA